MGRGLMSRIFRLLSAVGGGGILLIVVLWCPVFANQVDSMQQVGVEQLLEAIDQKASSIKTIDCSFAQKRFLSVFKNPVSFTGRLVLDRPTKLRWEIIKPIPSVLVFNGSKGMHCQGEGEPRTFDLGSDPIMRIVSQQLWSWLSGNYSKLRQDYSIALQAENILSLTPKEAGTARYISTIDITFEPTTMQPSKVVIYESPENRTEITFFDYQLNTPVDHSLFSMCRPE